MSVDRTVDARGPRRKHRLGFTTERLERLRCLGVAVRAALRAREASRRLEADYRTGRRKRPGWVDVPVEPAKPGEVQILSRQVYVGPTLEDLQEFTKVRQQ